MPVRDPPLGHAEDGARKKAIEFPRYLTPELSSALAQHPRDFLAHQGINDEPVVWHPPTDLLNGLDLPRPDPNAIDIALLHQLIRRDRHCLSAAAERVNATLDDVRYALESNPVPAVRRATRRSRKPRLVYHTATSALPRERLIELYEDERNSLRDSASSVGVSRVQRVRYPAPAGVDACRRAEDRTSATGGDAATMSRDDKVAARAELRSGGGTAVHELLHEIVQATEPSKCECFWGRGRTTLHSMVIRRAQ